MAKTRAIFFDLDDTLVWLDTAEAVPREIAAWETIAADVGFDANVLHQAHRAVVPEVWHAADERILNHRQRVDGMDVMLETYHATLRSLGINDTVLARRVFDAYWSSRAGIIKPFDETRHVLESLHGHYRLAVITNGPAMSQLDKLEINGLNRFFDVVIASGNVGYAKPDAEVFRIALSKLDAKPSTAWHVGDNPVSDVLGARNAGLTAVWLNRHGLTQKPEHAKPHHEIASLHELRELLR